MAISPFEPACSIIPFPANFDQGTILGGGKDRHGVLIDCTRIDADTLYQMPRKEVANQKLGLLAFFDLGWRKSVAATAIQFTWSS